MTLATLFVNTLISSAMLLPMIILGIESSCDETACGIVKDGTELLANAVFSSMDLHAQYGGVVPEIAARSHIESIVPVIEQALSDAFRQREEQSVKGKEKNSPATTLPSALRPQPVDPWDMIDGIAVTYGAGLGGSLLVGVMTARTLAIAKDKPLYAINHVEGHVYANFLTSAGTLDDAALEAPLLSRGRVSTASSAAHPRLASPESPAAVRHWKLGNKTYVLPTEQPIFPCLALIVSGGHSQLALFRGHFDYTLLGQTQDDAIGEAFDKVAKILGLPYPGGPSVGKKALEGNPYAFTLPKAKMSGKYDFSFSGLKTAVLRHAQAAVGQDFTFPSKNLPEALHEAQKADIAAVFQRIAVETVVDKTIQAYEEYSPVSVVIAGGVAASSELRRQLEKRLGESVGRSQDLRLDAPQDAAEEAQQAVRNGTVSEHRRPATQRGAKNTDRAGGYADTLVSVAHILRYTDPKLCTDNGAMIATLGCYKAMLGQPTADPYSLEISPDLSM
ncbi:tRNA (adenosine(37)-N6)-threonylcarbamoyltransferase complex transferase subunit TsaD [soil metagenome]